MDIQVRDFCCEATRKIRAKSASVLMDKAA